jgi:hypothetical protein
MTLAMAPTTRPTMRAQRRCILDVLSFEVA